MLKRILIVDDAEFMRMALKTMLQNNGFEVVGEAENGAIGVQKYVELKPDVVTMDITMREMDGIEALKEIKKIDSDAKVIMISSMGQEKFVREAVMIGAKTFIVKPFKEEHVVRILKQIVED